MNSQSVLGFLAAPDRESSLLAVSLAILRIHARPLSYKAIAKVLECSADTVKAAANEESMLSFDSVARLGYFFPDEFSVVQELWAPHVEAPTMGDRLKRIDHELAAIKREAV